MLIKDPLESLWSTTGGLYNNEFDLVFVLFLDNI